MITITEQISIKADLQKTWRIISDLEISLSINQFHKKIIIPDKFSLTNGSTFNIVHNFGLGAVNMNVKIIDYIPLKKIELLKINHEQTYTSFEHSINYEIEKNDLETILHYSTTGSFNFKIQNIPFKPILTQIIKKELRQIKNIIESADNISNTLETKITTT